MAVALPPPHAPPSPGHALTAASTASCSTAVGKSNHAQPINLMVATQLYAIAGRGEAHTSGAQTRHQARSVLMTDGVEIGRGQSELAQTVELVESEVRIVGAVGDLGDR